MLRGTIFPHNVSPSPLRLAGESSMGSGCSRTLENSLMCTTWLHFLQGHCPGGCSVPRRDLHSPSRCGIEAAAPVPEDMDGQGTGHAQKTMSNYPGASGSNVLWLEKLFFVPHSRMTCRSRRCNYMEMDLVWELLKTHLCTLGGGRERA